MILDQDKISRIKNLLKSRPKGLTISDIAQVLKINRNSVAKYLEILLITGQVEMRVYGNAKVFYLSQRVPISSMLKFATELIVVIDRDLKITDVNENFLSFYNCKKENLIGELIKDINLPPFDELGLQNTLMELPDPGEYSREIEFFLNEEKKFFRIKIIPTVFDDGGKGITFIIEDITHKKEIEEQLRINEARYRAIVEDQTEMIVRFRPDFSISFANSAFCQYLNIEYDEIIGKNIYLFISPRDREGVEKNIRNLSEKMPVCDMEFQVIMPKGEIRWNQWSNRAIFNNEERIVEYQGVGRDITDKKRVQEELLIKEKAISDSVNGIVIADINGNITYANRAYMDMIGFGDIEDVLHRPIKGFSYLEEDDLKAVDEIFASIFINGKCAGVFKTHKIDGSTFDVYLSATLVKDEHGSPLCTMASFVDITEIKKAKREIKILETAIAASIDGIAIFDDNKDLIYANNAFLRSIGCVSADIKGENFNKIFSYIDFIHPDFDNIGYKLENDGYYSGEARLRRNDGIQKFFQISANRIKDEDEDARYLIVCSMDITDQKMMEKTIQTTFEKLQEAIEFIPDPTFIVDRNNKVIAWNSALEYLTGVKKGSVIGKSDYSGAFSIFEGLRPVLIDIMNLPPRELATMYPQIRRFGDSVYIETFIPTLNEGKGAYLWGKASPLFDNERNVIGAIESIRDMSEWRRAKESLWQSRNRNPAGK